MTLQSINNTVSSRTTWNAAKQTQLGQTGITQQTALGDMVRDLKNSKQQLDELDTHIQNLETEIPKKLEEQAVSYMRLINEQTIRAVLPAIIVLACGAQPFSIEDVADGLVRSNATFIHSKLYSVLQRNGLQREDLLNTPLLIRKFPRQYELLFQYLYFIVTDDDEEQLGKLSEYQQMQNTLIVKFNEARQSLIDYDNGQTQQIQDCIDNQQLNTQQFVRTASLRIKKFEETLGLLTIINNDSDGLYSQMEVDIDGIQRRRDADYLVCIQNINILFKELIQAQYIIQMPENLSIEEVQKFLTSVKVARDVLLITIGVNFGYNDDSDTQISIDQKMTEYQSSIFQNIDSLNLFMNELVGIFRASKGLNQLDNRDQLSIPDAYQELLLNIKRLSTDITVEQDAITEKIDQLKKFSSNSKLVFKTARDLHNIMKRSLVSKQETKSLKQQLSEIQQQADDCNELERDTMQEMYTSYELQLQQKMVEKDKCDQEMLVVQQQLTNVLGIATKLRNEEIFEILFLNNYQDKTDLKLIFQYYKVIAMHIASDK